MDFSFITPKSKHISWVETNINRPRDEVSKLLVKIDRIEFLHYTIAAVMYCYNNIEEDLNANMDRLLEPFIYELKYGFLYRKKEIKEIIKRGKELTPRGLVEIKRNHMKEILEENLKKLSKTHR